MPKILIMVLSFNQPPYSDLMKMQQATWDSIEHPDVRTVYYYGGNMGWVNDREFSANADDNYYRMHWKFALALDEVFEDDWDFIYRTNSSSYVNKEKLVEVAKLLPKEKLYSGYTMVDSNYDGGLAVSGAGIWLSRDVAEILLAELMPEENCEEDVLIGRILRQNGITAIDDRSRIDYPQQSAKNPRNAYHIRFKSGGLRYVDVENMRLIHNQIINK